MCVFMGLVPESNKWLIDWLNPATGPGDKMFHSLGLSAYRKSSDDLADSEAETTFRYFRCLVWMHVHNGDLHNDWSRRRAAKVGWNNVRESNPCGGGRRFWKILALGRSSHPMELAAIFIYIRLACWPVLASCKTYRQADFMHAVWEAKIYWSLVSSNTKSKRF